MRVAPKHAETVGADAKVCFPLDREAEKLYKSVRFAEAFRDRGSFLGSD